VRQSFKQAYLIGIWSGVGFKQALESVKDALAKAEPWPAITSVQIKNDIILVVVDKNALAEAKTLVNLN
jgi:hypothetical protein